MFLLNTILDMLDLRIMLDQIMNNIIAHNDEEKYRTLKVANNTVRDRVLSRSGGLEFLQALGFRHETDSAGCKVLKLHLETDSKDMTQHVLAATEWLANTTATCVEMAGAHGTGDKPCCECIIQVRLPTGATVSGGFMRGDSLQDVRDFACCYFSEDRCRRPGGWWIAVRL